MEEVCLSPNWLWHGLSARQTESRKCSEDEDYVWAYWMHLLIQKQQHPQYSSDLALCTRTITVLHKKGWCTHSLSIPVSKWVKEWVNQFIQWYIHDQGVNGSFMSASVPQAWIPHSQTVLTKHIEVAALGHKMWQFINCFLQSYMLLIFLFT